MIGTMSDKKTTQLSDHAVKALEGIQNTHGGFKKDNVELILIWFENEAKKDSLKTARILQEARAIRGERISRGGTPTIPDNLEVESKKKGRRDEGR